MDIKAEYNRWLENVKDNDLLDELKSMEDNKIEDSFYRDLAFGTVVLEEPLVQVPTA